jgi:hypothetical protein
MHPCALRCQSCGAIMHFLGTMLRTARRMAHTFGGGPGAQYDHHRRYLQQCLAYVQHYGLDGGAMVRGLWQYALTVTR